MASRRLGEYYDENIGKVTRMAENEADPLRAGPEGHVPGYTRNHKPRTAGFEFDKVLALAKAGFAG